MINGSRLKRRLAPTPAFCRRHDSPNLNQIRARSGTHGAVHPTAALVYGATALSQHRGLQGQRCSRAARMQSSVRDRPIQLLSSRSGFQISKPAAVTRARSYRPSGRLLVADTICTFSARRRADQGPFQMAAVVLLIGYGGKLESSANTLISATRHFVDGNGPLPA